MNGLVQEKPWFHWLTGLRTVHLFYLSFALSTLGPSFEINSVQKWEEVILMAAICEEKLAEYLLQRQLSLRLESLLKRTNDSFAPQRY